MEENHPLHERLSEMCERLEAMFDTKPDIEAIKKNISEMVKRIRENSGEGVVARKEATLCIRCKFADAGWCLSETAPITDFVFGTKSCHAINPKGECRYYDYY